MWKDIFSHKNEIELLKSYISSGKIPHALLFSGLKGIGKTRVALEFFKALNCLKSPGDACESCSSCIKANNYRHPDLIRILPEGSEIKVESVRNVINELGLRPYEAAFRVIIVEPAELMNKSSSNALLKTLEEPPKGTILILVSHKPGLLIPTIISRCQEISFKPIDPKECGLNIDPVILRLTSGALGGLSDSDTEYVNQVRSIVAGVINGSDPFNCAEKLSTKGCDLLVVLSVIESIIRDLLLMKTGLDNVINEEVLKLKAYDYDISNLERAIEKLNEIRSMKDSSINIKSALSAILYDIAGIA
jgi:DNA polymerase-3 subunit delta'